MINNKLQCKAFNAILLFGTVEEWEVDWNVSFGHWVAVWPLKLINRVKVLAAPW